MLGSAQLFSQVTTATLNGTVFDQNNDPLEGATVVAVHLPSGTQYGTTTRDDGKFTLPNMRVGGPYTVQASFVGYENHNFDNITLSLAQKLNLEFTLKSSSVTIEGVEVVAISDPLFNGERTGAATNISSDQLRNLPTISRSAFDYTRLTPSADGGSFGGRNDQFNNFSLDGTIFNNPFGLDAATPGGQTDAQPVSLDAIDQIQVAIAPYDVTQAGFTGASVNAVTKSGTNNFAGTVFGFYRNQDLTGAKVNKEKIFVPDLTQFQTGFSLGGPIVKDKLFFFVNAELERREDLGSNFIAAAANRTGENVSRVEAADLEAVSDALFQRFGYETGPYENYNHKTHNQKGIVKLDWNINSSNTLTATYNFLDAFKEKPAHPSAIGRRGPDAVTLQFFNSGYQINNVIHSGIVELKSLFGNQFSNKFQAGYTFFDDSRDPFSDPFPVININKGGSRYIVAGHEPFSIHNRLEQRVLQLTDNFNIYAGDHTITVGASLERFSFDNSFNLGVYDSPTNAGGTFAPGWESTAAFVTAIQNGEFDDEVAFAEGVFAANGGDEGVEGEGWALAETNLGQLGVYLQDEWDVTDRFNLTVGLRMDMPLYFDTPEKAQENIDRQCCYDPSVTYFDEDGNPIKFDHTVFPDQKPLFSPRVGFNYDLMGDRSSQLRGGTGLFSGRFPFVWVGNQVANPNFFFYTVTRPDFKFPQVWRSNLGFDQKFANGWSASIDLVYTKDINGMMVRNYGIKPPSGKLSGVDTRPIYLASDRTTPYSNNAYVFTNVDIGYTFNASIQLQKTWASGLYLSLGYNFLDAKDASSIEAEISSDAFDRNPALNHVNEAVLAPSLYGNRHRVVGTAMKKFSYGQGAWATSFALFFQYAQGGRFSYTYSGDINNDGSFLNDLIYIPTESEIGQMQFTGTPAEQASQRTGFNNFIAQDEYLSENRGNYAEKYGILSPWYSSWDLRILQDLNLQSAGGKTKTVQFSIDILNLGNLISSKWGVRELPTNTQPVSVFTTNGVPAYTFDTSLQSTFSYDFSLFSRWQLQVGLRYIF